MDESLQEKIENKINETFLHPDEIFSIVKSLSQLNSDQNSFAYGIAIGRLYNSFYYQCRRILKRNPTKQEFSEFLDILKEKESKFLEKLESGKN